MASRENLNPHALGRIAKELQKMVAEPVTNGIRVIVNERDLTDIQADIEGPTATPYEGGVFRCKLVIGSEFPTAPPRGFFLTKIFHPNVAPSGDICVNTLKKDWTPDLGLMHVLQVIRCLLIVPFPESALNEEASRLFLESYEEYSRRATLVTSIHAMAHAKTKPASDLAAVADSSTSASTVDVDTDQAKEDGGAQTAAAKPPKAMPMKKTSRSALKRL
jgi:ubiquitin-conjugating enzyme E2 S